MKASYEDGEIVVRDNQKAKEKGEANKAEERQQMEVKRLAGTQQRTPREGGLTSAESGEQAEKSRS